MVLQEVDSLSAVSDREECRLFGKTRAGHGRNPVFPVAYGGHRDGFVVLGPTLAICWESPM